MMRTLLAGLVVATLAACAAPVTRLQYPDGRVVECGGHVVTGPQSRALAFEREAKCVDDHMAQGARRL